MRLDRPDHTPSPWIAVSGIIPIQGRAFGGGGMAEEKWNAIAGPDSRILAIVRPGMDASLFERAGRMSDLLAAIYRELNYIPRKPGTVEIINEWIGELFEDIIFEQVKNSKP